MIDILYVLFRNVGEYRYHGTRFQLITSIYPA